MSDTERVLVELHVPPDWVERLQAFLATKIVSSPEAHWLLSNGDTLLCGHPKHSLTVTGDCRKCKTERHVRYHEMSDRLTEATELLRELCPALGCSDTTDPWNGCGECAGCRVRRWVVRENQNEQ